MPPARAHQPDLSSRRAPATPRTSSAGLGQAGDDPVAKVPPARTGGGRCVCEDGRFQEGECQGRWARGSCGGRSSSMRCERRRPPCRRRGQPRRRPLHKGRGPRLGNLLPFAALCSSAAEPGKRCKRRSVRRSRCSPRRSNQSSAAPARPRVPASPPGSGARVDRRRRGTGRETPSTRRVRRVTRSSPPGAGGSSACPACS